MTVIAYRDKIIAADSRVTAGDYIQSDTCQKLLKNSRGQIAGTAGSVTLFKNFKKWFMSCPKMKEYPGFGTKEDQFSVIIVKPSGKIYMGNKKELWSVEDVSFTSVGTGQEFAKGAMEVGASAEEAVRVAIRFAPSCGGKIQTLKLDAVAS